MPHGVPLLQAALVRVPDLVRDGEALHHVLAGRADPVDGGRRGPPAHLAVLPALSRGSRPTDGAAACARVGEGRRGGEGVFMLLLAGKLRGTVKLSGRFGAASWEQSAYQC